MVTLYFNNYSLASKIKRKTSLTFSLATIFIIVSSLSFLIHINTIENVESTIDSGNTTTTSTTTATATPPTIERQLPVDAKTGAEIIKPPQPLVTIDPVTGQREVITSEAIIKDPTITEGSFQLKTTEDEGGEFVDPQIIGNDIRGFNDREDFFDTEGSFALIDPRTGALKLEDKTESAPTFNPFFRSCDQRVHDVAKYTITGEVNKFRFKDNEFSLNIFADLLVNDLYNFDKKDKNYPYKANFKIDNDDVINVDLDQFNTNCIDLVTIQNPADAQVDLEKSEALKELGFHR